MGRARSALTTLEIFANAGRARSALTTVRLLEFFGKLYLNRIARGIGFMLFLFGFETGGVDCVDDGCVVDSTVNSGESCV